MYCEKCGTQNDADTKFCVGCGSQLSASSAPNGYSQMNMRQPRHAAVNHQAPVIPAQPEMMRSGNSANPIESFWNGFLFPERMIIIGAIMGCVAAIFWGASVFILSAFYFLTMASAMVLIYFSREGSSLKKIELARWQIAVGAFWLSLDIAAMQIMNSVGSFLGSVGSLYGSTTTSSYTGSIIFSLWLSLFSSALILAGGIMLQGIILRHAFGHKDR